MNGITGQKALKGVGSAFGMGAASGFVAGASRGAQNKKSSVAPSASSKDNQGSIIATAGEVTISEKGKPGIAIDGFKRGVQTTGQPEYVQQTVKALNTIEESCEEGAAMVNGLEDSEMPIEIIAIKNGNNSTQLVSFAQGDNTTLSVQVRWNPNLNKGGVDINGSRTRPPFIGLANELENARQMVSGQYEALNVPMTYKLPMGPVVEVPGLTVAEFMSNVFENIIRNAKHITPRNIWKH
jgi:hypothetical protein